MSEVNEDRTLNERTPNSASPETPQDAPPEALARAQAILNEPPAPGDPDVIAIPRHTLNYVLIAVTFLVIGVVLGVVGYDRLAVSTEQRNSALIDRAVATAVAAMPRGVAAAPTADPNQRFEVEDAGNPSRGPADAPITLIEFGDFRCGFCRRFNNETLNVLLEQYPNEVRYVFRDYPILGPDSMAAALASECADDQGKFWEFHDWAYENQANLTRENFLTFASDHALDVEAFTACLDDNPHQAAVLADYEAGQSLNVGGTPTFFLNGRRIIGAQPLRVFQQAIEAELAAIRGGETGS
ncbi:MAG: DsbA family protein [Candidatus Flexifilum sp.]|jgi:protein-disulfide isomerase